MSIPLIMRVMALSLNIAKRAGGIVRDVMQKGNLGIVVKGKDDLQTEADRLAERTIIASLVQQFPDIKIIGEEGSLHSKVAPELVEDEFNKEFLAQTCPADLCDLNEKDFVIWVDPLDGTSEYTQGYLQHVTVLIGIAVQDIAVGGIIHQPYYQNENGELGRTIWGLKGLGTGGFTPTKLPTNQLIVTTTRSHSNQLAEQALAALQPTEIIRVGGAGYKVLQLLEGKANLYFFASSGCKKWDTCAPQAVLEAQGGTLTDIFGQQYKYHAEVEHVNKTGVVASISGIKHNEIISKIPSSVREAINAKI